MSANRERPKLCTKCGRQFQIAIAPLCHKCYAENLRLVAEDRAKPAQPILSPPRLAESGAGES